MLVNKGYKYRIYPSKAQAEKLNQIFGCTRFVYNHFLALRQEVYRDKKKTLAYNQCANQLPLLKQEPETRWLADCDSMALQESVKDLDKAFNNFFEKRGGYPRFHRKNAAQSYRTRNQNNGVRIEGSRIRLPKIGSVKAKISRLPNGRILNATVTRVASGKYFVSLCCEEELEPKGNAGCLVGIDVGLKVFYTDSNGSTVDNPRTLSQHEKKLRREQRKLSRMIEANIIKRDKKGRPVFAKPLFGCKNLQKQRIKVARIHEKIQNTRMDFLHKQSRKLVSENQVIAIEDLHVKGMVKNHRLAKAITDVSWSAFFNMLEYKAFEHGCEVVKVPTFYPSSQTCSSCGHKNPIVKNLSVREWSCPVCGAHHDRDLNAAQNILTKALSTVGHTETHKLVETA